MDSLIKPRQGQSNVSCLSDLLALVHRHDLTLEVGLVTSVPYLVLDSLMDI